MSTNVPAQDMQALKEWIKAEALRLGFAEVGIARPDTRNQIEHLKRYLADNREANMKFLHENHDKRIDPTLLVENTQSIISVRLNYLIDKPKARKITDNNRPNSAIIARYARGRDYHKTMRGLLKKLAQNTEQHLKDIGLETDFTWRPFADSAPIFEKVLAENAGLGWTGKNTLLMNKKAGSFFVLGELFTSLPLPFDAPAVDAKRHDKIQAISLKGIPEEKIPKTDQPIPTIHCGKCVACIRICPTQAIIGPFQLNAERCIAFQTIENKGTIPHELRKGIGNRIFGCDDCQLICPWNSFSGVASVKDFEPRHSLDDIQLLDIWQWLEPEFLKKSEGSPLRRTGYVAFMRNVAVALGNAPFDEIIVSELQRRYDDFDENVQEHIDWALAQQEEKKLTQVVCANSENSNKISCRSI